MVDVRVSEVEGDYYDRDGTNVSIYIYIYGVDKGIFRFA